MKNKILLQGGKWCMLFIFSLGLVISFAQEQKEINPQNGKQADEGYNQQKLVDVLKNLKKNYEVDILFEDKVVRGIYIDQGVINFKESLDENFRRILEPNALTFRKLKDTKYIIYKGKYKNSANSEAIPVKTNQFGKKASFGYDFPRNEETNQLFNLEKPEVSLTGVVNGENNLPLSGVTINEKGTDNTVTTNDKGAFIINVAGASSILHFSYTGYLDQEVSVANKLRIDVILVLDPKQMEDVVVVGYGRQKKITVVGAQSSVSSKELTQSPVANISNSLVGRAPGLFATQASGEPGNDQSRLLIRGIGTFSGNQAPLVLVDGIQVESFNNIDPNEIENITILKDASSTAVFGIRGANGVILITTKRGQTGVPVISFTSNTAFNSFTNIRERMGSPEYATSFNKALQNDSYVTGNPFTPRFSQGDIDKFRSGEDPLLFPNVNWFDEVLKKTSLQHQYNLNIRGGTNKVKYFISGGYFSQEGLFKNTKLSDGFDGQINYKRYNFRSNLNFDVTKRFKVAVDIATQLEDRSGNNGNTSSIMNWIAYANPLGAPTIANGGNRIVTSLNGTSGVNPFTNLLSEGFRRDFRNLINGSVRLDHDLDFITKGLNIHGIVAYQNFNRQVDIYRKNLITWRADRLPDNSVLFAQQGDDQPLQFSTSNPNTNQRTTIELALNYKRSFGDHTVTGLLLYNQLKTIDPSFAFGVPNGYQSYVGRVVYDYKGKYLAELSGAYNGTENFAPGQRFGFFPSYSLGWVPTSEDFFPRNNFISFLKIRASFGEVGNDQLSGDFLTNPNSRFLYRPTAFTGNGAFPNTTAGFYWFGEVGSNFARYSAIREGRSNNPFLTWERAKKSNLGIEANFWKDRINVIVDFFDERRDNILAVPQTVSSIIGTPVSAQNLGRMNNKGYEVDITFRGKVKEFNYWVKANYSYATNVVVFQDEITRLFPYQQRTGQRFGQIFGLIADGLYNSWEEVNDPKRPISTFVGANRLQPGDIKYRDINGDGIINFQDEAPIGKPSIPESIFGVSFGANYKGFDISVLFQGATNVSINYSRFAVQGFYDVNLASAPKYLSESWSQERFDAGLPINFPRLYVGNGANGFNHNLQTSTYFVDDASYVRLKNMEIGYTLMPNTLKKLKIKSIRIFANANNLITWTGILPGLDPETVNLGTNIEPYPLVRTINIGASLTF